MKKCIFVFLWWLSIHGYSYSLNPISITDSCKSQVLKWSRSLWTITYQNGTIVLREADRVKMFTTIQDFKDCPDFSFNGLYVKKVGAEDGWARTNIWSSNGVVVVTALDGLGRCMLFVLDLTNEKLFTLNNNEDDFQISRFNRVYFDPATLTFAIAGEYEDDYDTNEVMTNVYFNKISTDGTLQFVKVKRFSKVDHKTIMSPELLFVK